MPKAANIDRKGIQINLASSEIEELINAMQKVQQKKFDTMRDAGVDLEELTATNAHCGVVICGG